tara:strand:- start:359 stop:802 length:444 start_codon:yes stop_codon:yes gene_type:complete
MTTEKRKRGRPRKNVEATVEKAEVAPHIIPEPELELTKFYWGYLYFVPAQAKLGGERLVGQITYTESTDVLELTSSEPDLPAWREFNDIIENNGHYDVIDPKTGSRVTFVRSMGMHEWMTNLDNAEFTVNYGNIYKIKEIDSSYEIK